MKGKIITLIYFYLVSLLAIIFLVVGVYNSVTFVVNNTQFENYPLRYGGMDRCGYIEPIAVTKEDPQASVSAKQANEQKIQCEKSLAEERIQHKVDDIKNGIVFTLLGIILFATHFPIALKRSKEE